MRSAIFAAPLMAAVAYAAKDTTSKSYTLVPELSGSVTITSTYRYTNPATAFLTETNSAGVVTGEPGQSTVQHHQPAVVTTQPQVATIPAGISGTTVIYYNGSSGVTSFTVSANKHTTEVLGHPQVSTASSNPFSSNGASPTGHGHHKGKPGSSPSGKAKGSASSSASSSSSTGGAAPTGIKVAGAGVIGLGAFVAALL